MVELDLSIDLRLESFREIRALTRQSRDALNWERRHLAGKRGISALQARPACRQDAGAPSASHRAANWLNYETEEESHQETKQAVLRKVARLALG